MDDYTGTHKVGVDCPKRIVADLDQHRKDVWAESEREVNQAKAENRNPWFIDETRGHLENIGSILGSLRPESSSQTGSNSQRAMVIPVKFLDQIYRDFRLSKDPTLSQGVDDPKDPLHSR